MKKIFIYIIVFVLGLVLGLYFLWHTKKDYTSRQIDIITQGIKNVSKLIVTEANYTEVYNYEDANKYFFDNLVFEKKVILLIDAKVQVSYDLRKLQYEIDTLHKRVIIEQIPQEEIQIFPSYKYYDLQQSMWNTFSKQELNAIQKNSYEKLKQHIDISHLKEKAKKRLIAEMQAFIHTASLLDWKVVDASNTVMGKEDVLKKLFQTSSLD